MCSDCDLDLQNKIRVIPGVKGHLLVRLMPTGIVVL